MFIRSCLFKIHFLIQLILLWLSGSFNFLEWFVARLLNFIFIFNFTLIYILVFLAKVFRMFNWNTIVDFSQSFKLTFSQRNIFLEWRVNLCKITLYGFINRIDNVVLSWCEIFINLLLPQKKQESTQLWLKFKNAIFLVCNLWILSSKLLLCC